MSSTHSATTPPPSTSSSLTSGDIKNTTTMVPEEVKVQCTKCKKIRPKNEMGSVKWSYGRFLDDPNPSYEMEYWCKDTAKECEPCWL